MIKCFSFSKSLKQLFIISLISCFILLVGSSVNAGFNEFNSFGTTIQISSNGNAYQENYVDNYCTVNSDLSFSCSATNNKLVKWNGGNYYTTAFYWSEEGLAYIHRQIGNCGGGYNDSFYGNFQGVFTGFTLCEGEFTSPYSCSGNQLLSYSEFVNYIKSNGLIGFSFSNEIDDLGVCFIGNNFYFCSAVNQVNNSVSFGEFNQKGLNIPFGDSCSWGFTGAYYTMDFSNVINTPIGGGNNGGNDYITIELTGDDYINYFEKNPNYNFDRNICYVGTNDLTTTGISGIPYYEGTGKNIVQLFAYLYGNTLTTKDLGTFLNTWNINYGTWYLYGNRDELDNPLYNAYYSLSGGFYLDYSDNLTNPFLTNPTAIYFMASTISDYGNRSTLGEEIATYCYYKLQRENSNVFDGINITDNHDSSIDENVGTFIENWNRYSYNQSGINVVAETWSDSDLDYFTGSDFVDFGTFFHESMQKLKSNFNVSDFDLGLGVLPGYIIFFLITLVLFRFLSH